MLEFHHLRFWNFYNRIKDENSICTLFLEIHWKGGGQKQEKNEQKIPSKIAPNLYKTEGAEEISDIIVEKVYRQQKPQLGLYSV